MIKKMITLILSAAFTFGTFAGEEEKPDFTERLKEGQYSIRTYSPMLVAYTKSSNRESLFRTLAGYIFGQNDRKEKIPMTAPVFVTRSDEAMTMMFHMPKSFESVSELPSPSNPKVKLGSFDIGTVAVITYSGHNSEQKTWLNYEKLLNWLENQNIEIKAPGNFYSAGYDSPWVPGNKRTNEVMIQLK